MYKLYFKYVYIVYVNIVYFCIVYGVYMYFIVFVYIDTLFIMYIWNTTVLRQESIPKLKSSCGRGLAQ